VPHSTLDNVRITCAGQVRTKLIAGAVRRQVYWLLFFWGGDKILLKPTPYHKPTKQRKKEEIIVEWESERKRLIADYERCCGAEAAILAGWIQCYGKCLIDLLEL